MSFLVSNLLFAFSFLSMYGMARRWMDFCCAIFKNRVTYEEMSCTSFTENVKSGMMIALRCVSTCDSNDMLKHRPRTVSIQDQASSGRKGTFCIVVDSNAD